MNTENCFTTVLWMALLLGYLQVQTHPVIKPQSANCGTDISFRLLRKDVSCGENLTFVTTENIEEICEANALETITNELNKMKNECTDNSNRINQTMEELIKLHSCPRVASSKFQREPSKCMWKTGSFERFLRYFKVFLWQIRASE